MTYPPALLGGEGDEESRLLPLRGRQRDEQILPSTSSSSSMMNSKRLKTAALFLVCTLLAFSGFLVAFRSIYQREHFQHLALEVKEKEQIEVKDAFVPAGCPGQILIDGVTDPRDVVINGASLAGLGDYGYEEAAAAIFSTGQYNKHSANWILATKAQGEGYSQFHMVMIQVTALENKAMACAVASGATDVEPDEKLDSNNAMRAWASRIPKKVSVCKSCPGYGAKQLVSSASALAYEEQISLYQVPDYISQTCPGDGKGYASSLKNVTVQLIDSYAGLAFLGGNSVAGGKAKEAVIFWNRNLYPLNVSVGEDNSGDDLFVDDVDNDDAADDSVGRRLANSSFINGSIPVVGIYGNESAADGSMVDPVAISYIVGYVDHSENLFKMVEVQVSVQDGVVNLCSPTAKSFNGAPENVNRTTIHKYWENADLMNVASCRSCAGYGATMFRFQTLEGLAATPEPSAAPLAAPSAAPSAEPTVMPTVAPTDLDVERGNYWAEDAADGAVDGMRAVVFVPIASPTKEPIVEPTFAPIAGPTFFPIAEPTLEPTLMPTSAFPTEAPLASVPSALPTAEPTAEPTDVPHTKPTFFPIGTPTLEPIPEPTPVPTTEPTKTSLLKLGRPCDEAFHDDYVDMGGVTFNGTAINVTADADIGSTNEYSGFEPTLEPTAEPTLEPTAEQTDAEGDPVPLQPGDDSENDGGCDGDGCNDWPPTPPPTGGFTMEPCVDEYWGVYSPAVDEDKKARAMLNAMAKTKDWSGLKSCEDHFPGFKNSMKMLGRVPEKQQKKEDEKMKEKRAVRGSKHIAKNGSSAGNEASGMVNKARSVEDMPDDERRAFYLAHFATPEQRAAAAKTDKADARARTGADLKVEKRSAPAGVMSKSKSEATSGLLKGGKRSVENMSDKERRAFYLEHFATPEQREAAKRRARIIAEQENKK